MDTYGYTEYSRKWIRIYATQSIHPNSRHVQAFYLRHIHQPSYSLTVLQSQGTQMLVNPNTPYRNSIVRSCSVAWGAKRAQLKKKRGGNGLRAR
jgi:hypothetical protein